MAAYKKLSNKLFKFKTNSNNIGKQDTSAFDALVVTIPEVVDPSYGMYVWPSAVVLAQYIWYHQKHITGKRILELGSGTALPGIVAAKVGGDVILSDKADLPECLERSRHSCMVNGLESVAVKGITWGQFDQDLVNLPPVDIVIAADCFYDSKDFEPVIVTIVYLMSKNPHLEFWTAYQVRSSERNIEHLLHKWQLDCRLVPLSVFAANSPSIAESALPGCHTIQMLIISGRDQLIKLKYGNFT